MKKFFVWLLGCIFIFAGCNKYDDGELWEKVNELDDRLTTVEKTLSAMNSNVNALQAIVNALQKNVYVTEVTQTTAGYVIKFSDGTTAQIRDGVDGESPYIGKNGNWWVGSKDTGVKAAGTDGLTPHIGNNGNWWIGNTDTGVKATGTDGLTPHIGDNGNWWIGNTDTGVKAAATDGQTPYIGDNGNWWIGDSDTGKPAVGKDGKTPFIGANGNWWIGNEDTGVKSAGSDGLTPHIGENGNWWIGSTDTGVKAKNENEQQGITINFPIIGVDIYNGVYYWTQTIDGVTNWLLDVNGDKIPVGGYTPIFKVDYNGYFVYSYDGGVNWITIYDDFGNPVTAGENCECNQFFQDVYVSDGYLYIILIDGSVVKIRIDCPCGEQNRGDIPTDPTTPTPEPKDPNVSIPYVNIISEPDEWGNYVGIMNFTGIQDPNTGEWLSLQGTGLEGQNIWVDVDNTPKGILVINLEDNTTRVKNDIVFTVDNSGSMGQEADAIANGILKWANMLSDKGLDVKFSVVGFGGHVGSEYDYLVENYGITGAMDFATSSELSSFLNHSTGTSRTMGYYGPKAEAMKSEASKSKWNLAGGENGAQAIRFANENFTFRATANRIYINFTDDCNFTGKNDEISVNYFKDLSKWPINNGTIHSVISNDKDGLITRASRYNSWELPWLMSDYTNGTTMFVRSDASDLQLDNLTVSDALTHSYTIRFIIPKDLFDGQPHLVRIVIISTDGSVRGVLEFYATFGTL